VDQAFDARLQFNERAVVGDVGDAAGKRALSGYFASMPCHGSSAIASCERDAVGLVVDLDDLTLTVWPMLSTSVG